MSPQLERLSRAKSLLPLVLAFATATAAAAQPFFDKEFIPGTIGPGSTSTLRFTIDNTEAEVPPVEPAEDLAFTDTLPAGVVIADTPGAISTCGGGGILSAPAGGSTITFSNGKVGAGETCFVEVNVISSTVGTHLNTSGELTFTQDGSPGSGGTASADLTVDPGRPGFSKSFSPGTIPAGGVSTLTFTIDNSANEGGEGNLSFTDDLPLGVSVASPANASTSCGGGTVDATPGGGTISFSGGSVSAEGSCEVSVDVTTTANGTFDNVSGELRFGSLFTPQSAGFATDTLEVPLEFLNKVFVDDPVPPGGIVTLEFTLQNPSRAFAATEITFDDDLEAVVSGLAPSGPLPATPCGASSSLSFAAGILTLSGGSLPAEGSCTFSVTLLVPADASPGAFGNTTTAVTATIDGEGFTGNAASDALFVSTAPLFTKEFIDDPAGAGGPVTLRFTIVNTSPTSAATDIAFTDDLETAIPGLAANSLVAPSGDEPEPLVDPCGSGSELTIPDPNDSLPPFFPPFPPDPTQLIFTGGSLTAAGTSGDSCTFDVVLDVPAGTPSGLFTNTTSELTATVDDESKTTPPASGDLVVIGAPRLVKEFTDDPVVPGGTVTLELRLEHEATATADATGIAFTDDLTALDPDLAGLEAVSVDSNGCPGATVDISTPTLIDVSGASLTPGETCTIVLTLSVPAGSSSGIFTNTTSEVSATVGGVAVTGTAVEDDLVVAGLILEKEFLDDPAIPGGTVTLRFTLDNTGNASAATGISFSDDLGSSTGTLPGLTAVPPLPVPCNGTLSGTEVLTFSGGSVAAGASCFFDVTLSVPATITNPSPPPPTVPSDGTYGNTTSVVTFSDGTSIPAFDALVVDSELLALTKEFTDDPTVPGGTVTLEITIENLDLTRAASAISFSDDLSAALAGLTIGSVLLDDCGGVPVGVGTDTLTYTGGSLAAGATCTIRLSLEVPAGPLPGDTFTNTTSDATGTIDGLPVTGSAASDDLRVVTLLLEKSFGGVAFLGETVTLSFTLTNLSSVDDAAQLAFTDSLPAGLTAVAPLPTTPCGAASSISGGSFLTFSGGSLDPGDDCTFEVTLAVPADATPGSFDNVTSDLFSAGLFVAAPATDALEIEPPPAFSKAFSPGSIGVGGTSTLTFTIDNSASTVAATGLAFTDDLPAGLAVANPPNLDDGCGGSLSAPVGSTSISYGGGSVGAGLGCTVSVDVTASATGSLTNTSGDLTSSSGDSGTASDTLVVDPQPGFSKDFDPNVIAPGGVSTLTFTIDNSGSVTDATALDFTDSLPSGVVVATPANDSTTCSGGTIDATPGGGTIGYSGGTVPAGTGCTVSVDVTSSALGTHENTSGDLTSSLGNSGGASDKLTVASGVVAFTKEFLGGPVLRGGQVEVAFEITNLSTTLSLTDIAFTDDLSDVLPGLAAIDTPQSGCGGGSLTGTTTLSFSGGSLAPSSSCTLTVTLLLPADAALGSHGNTTGELTAETSGAPLTADPGAGRLRQQTAALTVMAPPATATLVVVFLDFEKVFAPLDVMAGTTTDLVFTLTNPDPVNAADAITFTDDLDAVVPGLAAVGLPEADVCGTGSQVSGTSVVTLAGGSLGPGESCSFTVTVAVPADAAAGTFDNLTSAVAAQIAAQSVVGDPAGAAQASLTVGLNILAIPVLDWRGLALLALLLAFAAWRLLRIG